MLSRRLAHWMLACSLGLALGLGCAEDEPEIPDECADGMQPTLEIINTTGNTIQVIYFVSCDMAEQSEFPLAPPGLADDESISIPFPGPGCWRLDYEGDGCVADVPTETQPLDCDATYEWMPDEFNHICIG
jgi:hypothetical protein